jgi:hypothetical protein
MSLLLLSWTRVTVDVAICPEAFLNITVVDEVFPDGETAL